MGVGSKCRKCPQNIRQRLLHMQNNCTGGNYGRSSNKNKMTASRLVADFTSSSTNTIKQEDLSSDNVAANNDNKPKYGSRKVFFERLWARLHNEKIPDIPKEAFPRDDNVEEANNDQVNDTDNNNDSNESEDNFNKCNKKIINSNKNDNLSDLDDANNYDEPISSLQSNLNNSPQNNKNEVKLVHNSNKDLLVLPKE